MNYIKIFNSATKEELESNINQYITSESLKHNKIIDVEIKTEIGYGGTQTWVGVVKQ